MSSENTDLILFAPFGANSARLFRQIICIWRGIIKRPQQRLKKGLHMKIKLTGKRIVSALLSIQLLAATALAAVMGQPIDGYDVYLGSGMELSRGVYWTGSDYRTENYIEYKACPEVYPVVVSGSRVCNTGSFSSMANLLEQQGKHVIAGINGDYYVVATGMPLGIVIENGVLRSSDDGHWAVGFRADGTAVIGKPYVGLKLTLGGSEYWIGGFNKIRAGGTASILTEDFSSNTKSSGKGIDLICTMSGTPDMGGRVSFTVDSVSETNGSVAIPQGKAVLSVDGGAPQGFKDKVLAMQQGETFTLDIVSPQGWEDVKWAIGSLYKLVTNGEVESGLPAGANPRSAVGIKADGSLVFYTMDGRRSGHSVGATMTQLAQRMVELGCTEAVIMDGGGSTSLNAVYIGDSSLSQINRPSDGYQRSVTNYIMLVTGSKPTGVPERLALYPLSTHILSGASTTFTLKAADANGYAASPGDGVYLSVSGDVGSVSPEGVFTASGEGTGSVIAESEGKTSASVEVNVVRTPDILRVYRQGTTEAVSSLSIKTGESVDLLAQAMDNYVYLISQDSCYSWKTEGDIGTINSEGVFTAGQKSAQGNITVSAGEKTVTIPVTVTRPQLYEDVSSESWYSGAVEYVSDKGLMKGYEDGLFRPEATLTRAMAVTTLHRSEGSPAHGEGSIFADVGRGDWYYDSVQWASEKGIAQGYGGMFDPNGNITREQLATLLYRYMGSPEPSGNLSGFSDASSVSTWAQKALTWAVEKGYINGMGDGRLDPSGTATRVQLASLLMRMKI